MASTIRKTAPQNRAPEDINTWLDELGLHRQKLMLNKNIGLAVADAVLIAEIIHAKYPKLIQVRAAYIFVIQHSKLLSAPQLRRTEQFVWKKN